MLETILIIIGTGIFIGFTGYYFCRGLDSWMDYGSIFYKFRLNKFHKLCSEFEHYDLKEQAYGLEAVISEDGENFSAHVEYMNKLFWELADRVHSFKLWICVDCMSVRYVLYVSILAAITLSFYYGSALYLLSLPLIFIIAISTIYKVNA